MDAPRGISEGQGGTLVFNRFVHVAMIESKLGGQSGSGGSLLGMGCQMLSFAQKGSA